MTLACLLFYNNQGLHLYKHLLADKSPDLSKAEKKITAVKPEQFNKITIIFTQMVKSCHF